MPEQPNDLTVTPQPIYSPEEAAEILDEKRPVPEAAYKVFGRGNMEKMVQLAHDPFFREVDQMRLSGQVSVPELHDYMVRFPEYAVIRKSFFDLTQATVEAVSPKLGYYNNQIIDSQGRCVNFTKENIENNRFFNFLGLISEAVCSQNTPRGNSFRNQELNEFYHSLVGMILYKMQQATYDRNREAFKVAIRPMVGEWLKRTYRNNNAVTSAAQMEEVSENLTVYKTGLQSALSQVDKPLPAIKDENELLQIEVGELSYWRRAEHFTKECGDTRIEVLPDVSELNLKLAKSQNICVIRLVLDKKLKPKLPEKYIFNMGGIIQEGIKYGHIGDLGYIDFRIDRASGELCLVNSQIPLRFLLNEEACEKLLNLALTTAKEFYSSKPVDIEDLTLTEKDRESIRLNGKRYMEAQAEKEARELEVRMIEAQAAGKEASLRAKEEAEKNKEQDRLNREKAAAEFKAAEEQRMKELYHQAIERLANKASKDIISAFARILGTPRKEGSHRTFTGANCKSYPLPWHKTEPVCFGILKRAFEVLDVSPIEIEKEI